MKTKSTLSLACVLLTILVLSGCNGRGAADSAGSASANSSGGQAGVHFPDHKLTPQQYQALMARLANYGPYQNSIRAEQRAMKNYPIKPPK